MVYGSGAENNKYKLLGFDNGKKLAVVMVIYTGKIVKIKLSELLRSEIIDDLNKEELKSVYRKFYSCEAGSTVYEVSDRRESSWMVYLALVVLLLSIYIFTNVAAVKPIYLEQLNLTVTFGVFFTR